MEVAKLVNIGCGNTWHSDWINLDISPVSPEIKRLDVKNGLPFLNESVNACYSSHIVEHLSKVETTNFFAECYRVLVPGGVIRIVVPDLELIVREYLRVLEAVVNGDYRRIPDYDWMMLELFDQITREKIGGNMAEYLSTPDLQNKEFIRSRIGSEAENYWSPTTKKSIVHKVKSKGLPFVIDRLREKTAEILVRMIAGKSTAKAFHIGVFRKRGEIHQWMYDRFSLSRLLIQSGFEQIKKCKPDESCIPGFEQYDLDINEDMVRKPESLFMEALKPQ